MRILAILAAYLAMAGAAGADTVELDKPDGVLRIATSNADMNRKGAGVLISDIRKFTSISERLDAAVLTQLINRFLTPMSQVLLYL